MTERTHHADGCRQAKLKDFGADRGLPGDGHEPLRMGSPGVERWNEYGVLVRVLGPKPSCVRDWSAVTCLNCLAKARRLGLPESSDSTE